MSSETTTGGRKILEAQKATSARMTNKRSKRALGGLLVPHHAKLSILVNIRGLTWRIQLCNFLHLPAGITGAAWSSVTVSSS